MASFVYQTVLEYGSSDQFLTGIREAVKEIRRCHPQLKHCILADLRMQRGTGAINVTLSFQSSE